MACETEPKNFKLIYFGGAGRAEYIRYIFAAGGVEFVDERVDFEKWPELKSSMPTGQLPCLEFECCGKTMKLPQSVAIAEFAAKVAGLYPECKVAAARSLAWVLCCMDFHETWLPWYKAKLMLKDEAKAADEWKTIKEEKIPQFGALAEKQLSESGNVYLLGDKLSWCDLVLADIVHRVLYQHDADAFNDFPKLKAHCEKVHQVPGLKAYMEKRPNVPF